MTSVNLVAKATIMINAGKEKTWDALIDPAKIKNYMFGTTVSSDWKKGSDITWRGEWQGKAYEDKGKILEIIPGQKLQYSHFSPLSGEPEKPENYHKVTITLDGGQDHTNVVLEQDNNPTEEARAHSEKNWNMMLQGLKKFVEAE